MGTGNRIDDTRLERLGNYFVYHGFYERCGITFETFLRHVEEGTWQQILDAV